MTTDAGELFWLADPQAPMHRRCALLKCPVPRLAAGEAYLVQDDRLLIGGGMAVDLSPALAWRAARRCQGGPADRLAARVAELVRSLDLMEASGFGRLIPGIVRLAHTGAILPHAAWDDAALRKAEPLVLGIVGAGLQGRPNEVTELSGRLIGLGLGLTPSGDDFVGGLLFAAHWLGTAAGLSGVRYAGRTNLISFTLLDDLAQGHAVAPLHDLLNGLLAGEGPQALGIHVARLLRIGHSTGWDLLAGLLTGLLIGAPTEQAGDLSRPAMDIQAQEGLYGH